VLDGRKNQIGSIEAFKELLSDSMFAMDFNHCSSKTHVDNVVGVNRMFTSLIAFRTTVRNLGKTFDRAETAMDATAHLLNLLLRGEPYKVDGTCCDCVGWVWAEDGSTIAGYQCSSSNTCSTERCYACQSKAASPPQQRPKQKKKKKTFPVCSKCPCCDSEMEVRRLLGSSH
jgi:hypothetical protein